MQTIRAAEARANFAALLRRVSENGERIVIERRGKRRVAVVPVEDLALAEGGSEQDPGAGPADEFLRLTRFAVDHASDAVFWIGPDAGFIYVNGTGSRALGYTTDELSKLKIFDIDPEVDEDNWPRAWERIKTKSPYTFEAQHRRKDGSTFPVEVSIYFLRFGDEEMACSFSRDITQRKAAEDALRESEALLAQAAQMANLGHWVWDEIEDRCVYCSEPLARSAGSRSRSISNATPPSKISSSKFTPRIARDTKGCSPRPSGSSVPMTSNSVT